MVGIRNTWDHVIEILQDNSYLKEDTNCFIWLGAKSPGLYGVISCEGINWLIHRLVFKKLVCEELTEVVRHSCDNPSCWNPEHLLGGSTQDNVDDMVAKRRNLFGEAHHRAVLNEATVREIRNSTSSDRELGKQYEIHHTAIYRVRNGITWKHVT